MRGALAGLLAFIGILLVPLADVGLWAQRELLARDELVELATDVVAEPEVRVAVAERVTDEIDARAGLDDPARAIVEAAVDVGLGTEPFLRVYRGAVGALHDQIERGDDRLVLRFDALTPVIRESIATRHPDIAARIPDELPVVTVITQDEVPAFFHSVDVVRRVAPVFPIVCVACLGAALALSTYRLRMLGIIGAFVAALALALVGVVELGRDALSDVTGPPRQLAAFEAGYGVVTHGFVVQTLVIAALGAVALVVAITVRVRSRRRTRPLGWA